MGEILIRNHCARDRIDSRFLPLIEATRTGILACCGEHLRELRLQGSIARGDAEVGHADLDVIALLEGRPSDREIRCLAALAARLGAETQVVSRFDLEAVDALTLEPFRRFVLSSDSLCIYGTDSLTLPAQTLERHALARLVTPDPGTMLPDYRQWVEELASADDAERRFASRIIGKDLLKVLRGVLLLRGAEYEAAIPRVAAQVPSLAPELASVGTRLLALYTEPTTSVEVIRQAVAAATVALEHSPELAAIVDAGQAKPASQGESAS